MHGLHFSHYGQPRATPSIRVKCAGDWAIVSLRPTGHDKRVEQHFSHWSNRDIPYDQFC
jgi:hypothetical protein